MAGFAIHLNLILAHPSARFSQFVPRGMQESHLLSNIVRLEDLECKAENSTKVYINIYLTLSLIVILIEYYLRFLCGIPTLKRFYEPEKNISLTRIYLTIIIFWLKFEKNYTFSIFNKLLEFFFYMLNC